jgi:hypothetical protein
MEYSIFTHGNALQIEDPGNVPDFSHRGWGAQATFYLPSTSTLKDVTVTDTTGPGSWFHLPLSIEIRSFGVTGPQADSVTLIFRAQFCRITYLHIYDGYDVFEEFDFVFNRQEAVQGLTGSFLDARPGTDKNTLRFKKPHRVLYGLGISFYACCYAGDVTSWDEQATGKPFPGSVLYVAAAGANINTEVLSLGSRIVAATRVLLGG